MTETENKFIIMARIAVSLKNKGFIAGVTMYPSTSELDEFASITVQDNNFTVVEDLTSTSVTEQELLNWWSAIEGDAA